MKIGLVIHGPEVIDSGEAKKVIEKLSCMGKVEAKIGTYAIEDKGKIRES